MGHASSESGTSAPQLGHLSASLRTFSSYPHEGHKAARRLSVTPHAGHLFFPKRPSIILDSALRILVLLTSEAELVSDGRHSIDNQTNVLLETDLQLSHTYLDILAVHSTGKGLAVPLLLHRLDL